MEHAYQIASFKGLNDSVFLNSQTISDYVEDLSVLTGINLDGKEHLFELDLSSFKKDLGTVYTQYLNELLQQVFGEGIRLVFQKVVSPNDYSRATDVIECALLIDEPNKFYDLVREKLMKYKEKIAPMIETNHSSSKCWFSLMSKNIDDWVRPHVIEQEGLPYLEYAMEYIVSVELDISDLQDKFVDEWYIDSDIMSRHYIYCTDEELNEKLC